MGRYDGEMLGEQTVPHALLEQSKATNPHPSPSPSPSPSPNPNPSPNQALLEQSKATLRATFSAIMRKRVFTLVFERSSELGWETVEKLHSARRNRGVVLCTGSAIKVCMPRMYTYPILTCSGSAIKVRP